MNILLSFLPGYLLGCINPAYILGKIKGFDIRKEGSKNAGASNALITMGPLVGVLTAVFDIFKAWLSFKIASLLFPAFTAAGIIGGSACMLGHMFPVFMGFKGGKGFACLGGTVLAYSPFVFFVMLLCALVIALLSNYICIVTVSAAFAFPVIYYVLSFDLIGTVFLTITAILVFNKHFINFRRIKAGTEARLSGLFNKQNEIDRIQKNQDNLYSSDEAE